MLTKTKPCTVWTFTLVVSVLMVWTPAVASAQVYESVGIRAQGMGGAFVAVADDATASWWNPAGLAHGAYASAVLEVGTSRQPNSERDAAGSLVPANRSQIRGFAAAFPALALSYYNLTISEVQPLASTAAGVPGRQDPGAGEVRLRSLAVSQFGVTVGQSIGEHLVLASTLKLLHGSRAVATVGAGGASLDGAGALEGGGETHGDLDMGAMAVFGRVRVGLAVKNLREPAFGPADAQDDARLVLRRQARAGAALVSTQWSLSVDADLTRTAGPGSGLSGDLGGGSGGGLAGDERRVAAGGEVWTRGRRMGLRGGVNVSAIGDPRLVLSGGVSVALRSSLSLDAQRTAGADAGRQGWGVGLRTTF